MANATPSKVDSWTTVNIGPNKYTAPPNTGNRLPLPNNNSFSTQDYTGRIGQATNANIDNNANNDLISPLGLTALTTAQLIIIPPNATSVTLIGSATFNFSETGTAGAALTQYVSWPANTPIQLDTARQRSLYVAGTGTLSFFFAIM